MPFFRRKTGTAEQTSKQTSGGTSLVRTPSNRSSRSTTSLPQTPNTPDSWGADNDIGYVSSFANGPTRPQTLVLSEDVLEDSKDLPLESLESPLRTSSRLSKTLLEVVRDKNALACFKAFMKSQRSDHLIQFWCDAESFHATTLTRLRTNSLHSSHRKKRTESANSIASETSVSKDEASDTQIEPGLSRGTSANERLSEVPSESPDGKTSSKKFILDQETYVKVVHTVQNQPEITGSSDHSKRQPDLNIPLPKEPVVSPDFSPTDGLTQGDHPPNVPSISSVPDVSASTLPKTDEGTGEIQASSHNDNDRLPGDGEETSPSLPMLSTDQTDISHKLKKSVERDAVTIFSTYLAKDAPRPIGVADDLRSEAISKICQVDGKVDPECFVNCQRFVLNKMDVEYFQNFKDSAFHCRHQVHVLTTEKVFLPDVLLNENALCYFMEYMEQDGASDLMQVWLCATNFQQQLLATTGSYDPGQAQTDAMVIYDKYFSLQATNPVGFDDKLRFEIEGNICREEGPLPDCFTKAKNIVLKMLEKSYFPSYLHSQIYHRYLSDLISTVQINEDIPQKSNTAGLAGSQPFKGHRRSESDASSEHSFSSVSQSGETVSTSSSARNTLLAVDTWRVKKSSKKTKINLAADFSMNLDMFNPDDLWKRPQANKLCLGSVNEFGQFVSDFDHETITSERRKASIGPLLFKKSKEKEKEEEEMALRIAQIIIRDVNTMTRTGETMAQNKTS